MDIFVDPFGRQVRLTDERIEGFIITAFFTDKLKKGEMLWQKMTSLREWIQKATS